MFNFVDQIGSAMIKIHFNALFLLAFFFVGPCCRALAGTVADSVYHDYIITSGGDTVKGKVLSLRTASVKIEPTTSMPLTVYKFGQVKEIRREGVTYGPVISMIGDRKDIFAKRILHGKIDLFMHTIHGRYGDLIAYYGGKGGEMPLEVKTNGVWPKGLRSKSKRRNNLVALIADDKELAKELTAKEDYSFDELIDLIKRYNKYTETL
jgi:hypothetical protein